MFDFNDVEKYLREGGSAETIAKAFTDKLNRAITAIEDESELKDCRADLVDAWNNYMCVYFKNHKMPRGYTLKDFYFEEKQVEDMVERIVGMVPVVDKICELGNKSTDTVKDFFDKFGI